MYLDHDGIVSLHNQLRPHVVEQSQTISGTEKKAWRGGVGLGAYGVKFDGTRESSSDSGFQIFEKTAPCDEQMLFEIEASLAKAGELVHLSGLGRVAELFASKQTRFVTGVLRFRWARSFDPDPVIDATKKEMVEFELDRDANDDAGMLSVPVRMGGSLGKCVSRKDLKDGSVLPTSHLACFLRELAHETLALGFFAQCQPLAKLVWLKP
jgi:hypothetical protein